VKEEQKGKRKKTDGKEKWNKRINGKMDINKEKGLKKGFL